MIELGGKVYEPASAGSYTLAYGLYMEQVLEDAGITQALSTLSAEADENTRQTAAKAAWVALVQSGKAAALIAGLLKPPSAPWSPAWATAAAQDLDAIDNRQDHQVMTEILLTGITSFFNVGPRS